MDNYQDVDDRWDLLEEMMSLRSDFAMNHAIQGFGMDFEKAVELIRSHNDDLTELEKEQQKVLLAALDNLIDFAIAEEFQMSEQLSDLMCDESDGENNDEDSESEDCTKIFMRYNKVYSDIENDDIEYAMGVAAGWIGYRENTVLVYMTQGDERVRPWHAALEGLSYKKRDFPSWLIPPIEHGCRCFLVEESEVLGAKSKINDVSAELVSMPDFVSPVFKESVAKGGRIFSEEHSYFQIPKKHKKRLKEISKRIKEKWLL